MKFRTIVALLVTVLVSIAGTGLATATTRFDRSVTDRELVLGLVYGVGPAADDLGVSAEVTNSGQRAAQARYESAAIRSVDTMLADYPADMESAIEHLRSGDPVRTEQGLSELGSVVNTFSRSQLSAQGLSPAQAQAAGAESTQACGVAVVCVAYAAAAVHNTVVVTGLAAVVVGGALWCGIWLWCGSSATDSTTQAAKERLVLDIMALS